MDTERDRIFGEWLAGHKGILFKVVHAYAFEHGDRHQRGKQPLAVVEGLLTTASSDGPDPRVEWLYRQIAQLKDVDRSVALLLLDGFTYKEIAAIVGSTTGPSAISGCGARWSS